MTNSYTKFQVNISKDCREKSGKLKCDGRTDGLTDGKTASKIRVARQAGRGLINVALGEKNCQKIGSKRVHTVRECFHEHKKSVNYNDPYMVIYVK